MEKRWVYYTGIGFIIIAMLIAGFVFLTAQHGRQEKPFQDIPEITLSVPSPPVLNLKNGTSSLSYMIYLSPFEKDGLNLVRVEVIDRDTGKTILVLTGEALHRAYHPGSGNPGPGTGSPSSLLDKPSVVTITMKLVPDNQSPPESMVHRFTFTSLERASLPVTIIGGETPVLYMNSSSR